MDPEKRNWEGQKVLIAGAGLSGIAAVWLLQKAACSIILYDGNTELDEETIRKKLPDEFSGDILLGDLPEGIEKGLTLVVMSPGISLDLPFVKRFYEASCPVIGEIELAYSFLKGELIAITGTNGKTTTTALMGHILRRAFSSVFVAGNIGIPFTRLVQETKEDSVTVLETSSFQLESILNFHPKVSMILNITPDHLDRHHTMEAYIAAKEKIAKNQTKKDFCILNYEDKILREFGKKLVCKVLWFSSERRLEEGAFLDGDQIIYTNQGKRSVLCSTKELHIIGKHNYENTLAAVLGAFVFGLSAEKIKEALQTFLAVEHRIEYVATKKQVKYYNDSKGTNPDASIQAVRAMDTKTILIAGGYDKNADYESFIKSFHGKIKYLLLMGQTREKMAEAARKQGFYDIVLVENMEEAVLFASKHAEPFEAVLLSPCCASWGMFKNYEERGRLFKQLVENIAEGESLYAKGDDGKNEKS